MFHVNFACATDVGIEVGRVAAISVSADRMLVPCTTSPTTLTDVCETATSLQSRASSNVASSLKRPTDDWHADPSIGGKRHLFCTASEQMGRWQTALFLTVL